MAYNSSGIYTRVDNSFSNPVVGTTISPTDADTYFDDIDGALNGYRATSTTSLDIATIATAETATWTIQTGKTLIAGRDYKAFSLADPTDYVAGVVTSYSGTSLTGSIVASGGSGTITDWVIVTAGVRGAQGEQGIQGDPGAPGAGSGDVTAASNFGTDNVVVRSDGASKGVQSTGVSIDDSNNVSGVAALSATTIELGHASDTTLARSSAGNVSIEGNVVYRAGGTDVPVTDGGTGASTAAAAATNLGLGTGDSPQFTAVNIGAATDTTVSRASAGDIAVEGNRIFRVGGVDVPIADGGTGQSTAAAAFDALAPTTTRGDIIFRNASTNARLAAGTSGYALIAAGAGADPAWGGYTQSGSATIQTWQARLRNWVFATDFAGATLDAQLNACQAAGHKVVFVPPGTHVWSATVTINTPMSIIGAGQGCCNINIGGFNNVSSDVLRVTPTSVTAGMTIHGMNFYFVVASGTVGQDLFSFVTSGSTNYVSRLLISETTVSGTIGGVSSGIARNALRIQNTGAHAGGGVTHSDFYRNNWLSTEEVVYFDQAGDALHFNNNIITSTNSRGYYVDLVAGAGNFISCQDTVACKQGSHRFASGANPLIINCIIEQTLTNTAGSIIDFQGGLGKVSGGLVFGNQIQEPSSLGGPIPINIDNADDIVIAGNTRINRFAAGTHISTTASSNRCIIDQTNKFFVNSVAAVGTIVRTGPGTVVEAIKPSVILAGYAIGVNANSVADTEIKLSVPSTYWRLNSVGFINTGTTASLTTAQFGLFSAAAAGGVALIASGSALTALTTNAANTTGGYAQAAASVIAYYSYTSLFFRITQAQGAAATINVYVFVQPLPDA